MRLLTFEVIFDYVSNDSDTKKEKKFPSFTLYINIYIALTVLTPWENYLLIGQ